MSGDGGSSAAVKETVKTGSIVALEKTGKIALAIANGDPHYAFSPKTPVGGLLWKLMALKGLTPGENPQDALLFFVLASHPSGRSANWAATAKLTLVLQAPAGTEREPIRQEITAHFGDWETEPEDVLASWADLENGYIEVETNKISITCEIEIIKAYGVRAPLKAPFNEDSGFSDVCLIAGGRRFYVSRSLMSPHSEVLSTMLKGNFLEGEAKEIVLHDVAPDGFEAFLNILYHVNTEVKAEDTEKVLAVADRFCVDHVLAKCASSLMSEPSALPMQKRLLIADRHNLPEFFDLLERAASNGEILMALVKTEDGATLSERANSCILRKMAGMNDNGRACENCRKRRHPA